MKTWEQFRQESGFSNFGIGVVITKDDYEKIQRDAVSAVAHAKIPDIKAIEQIWGRHEH